MAGIFTELRRRNVFKVSVAYIITGWILVEAADVLLDGFEAPGWVFKTFAALIFLGFPVAVIFAWAFELTPGGLKREKDVDRSQSITPRTGRKLDFMIIGLLVVALGYFVVTHDWGTQEIGRSATANGRQSIAVLPFTNRSALDEDVFFVDGVHDDLLTLLSKLGGLKVISRTSMEKFRGGDLSIPEVAESLGVATVLEGAVQRAGGQVRINVQLIDADTDEHLWAETYDRELTAQNVFAIQSDIAQEIAAALQAVLSPEEQHRVASIPTVNFAAYEEYLRGRQQIVTRTLPGLRKATEHFQRAIELDPDYALAYSSLADVYYLLEDYGGLTASEAIPLIEAAVGRALSLDGEFGEAYATLANLHRLKGDFEASFQAYERAIELTPNYATAYHWYAEVWRQDLYRPDQALPLIQKARELDPLSPVINITVAETLRDLGRREEAAEQANYTIQIAPDYPSAYFVQGQILWGSFGDLAEAVRMYEAGFDLSPGSFLGLPGLAGLYSDLGDKERAVAAIESVIQAAPDYVWANVQAVIIYRAQGDRERSLLHARKLNALLPGLPIALVVLRDSDLDRGEPETAQRRYLDHFPEFAPDGDGLITSINFDAAIDYAYVLKLLGESAQADALLRRSLAFLDTTHRVGWIGYGIADAKIAVIQGDEDTALKALEEAVEAGWRQAWAAKLNDRALDPIRDDPRFKEQIAIIEADMATQRERLLAQTEG